MNEMFRAGPEHQEHSVNFVTTVDVDWVNLGSSSVKIPGSITDSCNLFGKKTVNRERARNAKIAFPRSHANGVVTARLGVRDPLV